MIKVFLMTGQFYLNRGYTPKKFHINFRLTNQYRNLCKIIILFHGLNFTSMYEGPHAVAREPINYAI